MCDLSGARTVTDNCAHHPASSSEGRKEGKVIELSVGESSCHSKRPHLASVSLHVAHVGEPTQDKYPTKTPLDVSWTSSYQQIDNSTVHSSPADRGTKNTRNQKDNTGANRHM